MCFVSLLQKELLARVRKENARTEYEDRNCGRFLRIFPPTERFQQEKYAKLMYSAFSNLVIGAGKNGAIAKEIERQYIKKYRVTSNVLHIHSVQYCISGIILLWIITSELLFVLLFLKVPTRGVLRRADIAEQMSGN